MTMQNREFTAKEKLPHAEFFHRLVRFCLLAYMRSNLGVESIDTGGKAG